jgi:deoxycytidine triphosphate deaminase
MNKPLHPMVNNFWGQIRYDIVNTGRKFYIQIVDRFHFGHHARSNNSIPMATILNDEEIKKLIAGKIIIDADPSCIKPNSYVLRLGPTGEFLNCGKEFDLSGNKKGIKVQPGHSVALTAFETIDLRRETVRKIFPENDLHAFISPSTDLSREGIVAPTTQVDAGYSGTLNWTITNTSNEVRGFIVQEKIFRITFFKLGEGETPLKPYDGEYQGKTGYVRSERKGAPQGMRENQWEDSRMEGGPEAQLENLIKSGYPWNLLGERLKIMKGQFETVTTEYGNIKDTLDSVRRDVESLKNDLPDKIEKAIEKILNTRTSEINFRWALSIISAIGILAGLIIEIVTNSSALNFLKANGCWLGIVIMIIFGAVLVFALKRRGKLSS